MGQLITMLEKLFSKTTPTLEKEPVKIVYKKAVPKILIYLLL